MSATPGFAVTPKQYAVSLVSAESLRGTPTTFGILVASSADDISVAGINIKATSTTAASLLFVFLYDGSSYYLVHEEAITAVNPTGSVASFEAQYVPDLPILVPTGWSLRVAMTDATSTLKISTVNAGKF